MESEASHRPAGWRRGSSTQEGQGAAGGGARPSLLQIGAVAGDVRVAKQLTAARTRYEEASRRVAALHAKFDSLQKELGGDIGDLNARHADLAAQLRDASKVLGDKAAPPAAGGVSEPRVPKAAGAPVGARGGGYGGAAAGGDWWFGPAYGDAEIEAEGSLHRTLALERGVRAAAVRVAGSERDAEAARRAMRGAVEHAKGMLVTGAAATRAIVHGVKYASAAATVVKKYVNAVFGAEQGAEESEWRADEARRGAQKAQTVAKASLGAAVGAANLALRRITADERAADAAAARLRGYGAVAGAAPVPGGVVVQPLGGFASYAPPPLPGGALGGGLGGYAAGAPLPGGVLVPRAVGGGGQTPLTEAKELIDGVVVMMQQLTHTLAGAGCGGARAALAAYGQRVAQLRARGGRVAAGLSAGDMGLMEKYAEVQVASFAGDLEGEVARVEGACGAAAGQWPGVVSLGGMLHQK